MMPLLLLALSSMKAESWYGPSFIDFEIPFSGSPYDAIENDVQVAFNRGAKHEQRIAFYVNGHWRAILLSHSPGTCRAEIYRNGVHLRSLEERVVVKGKNSDSFIRIESKANRFQTSDGKPFWPVGHNLGWQSGGYKPVLVDQLGVMGKAGLNWSRIWSCSWDRKNPYVLEGKKLENPRDMFPEVLNQWDGIVTSAEKAGVHFQWVLFHHGEFSSNVNPNWPDHPWNKKNGGFLEKPDDFFTDPEAIRRSKNWLRYAVARWGHSPSIFAWELFNEVEWCDGMRNNPAAVGKWHAEMASYLRSIDPYHHLVTTSSWLELPIWKAMDYYQPHGYPPDVRAMVMGMKPAKDKPLFYGEVGLGEGQSKQNASKVIRDSVWGGLMAGHAGSAQFWYWDLMSPSLYDDYRRFTSFVSAHHLTEGRFFSPLKVGIEARKAGAVTFAPGQGWAKTTQYAFNMPEDAFNGSLAKMAGFIQGPGKKDMMAEPIRFNFEAGHPGRFEMRVSSVAKSGANIKLLLDGSVKVDEKVAGQDKDIALNKTFGFDFGPGKHTVTVANDGPDWFVAASFKVGGIGRAVSGSAAQSGDRVLLWLNRNTSQGEMFTVGGLPKTWMKARLFELNLDTGSLGKSVVPIRQGNLSNQSLQPSNAIWLLEKG